MPLIDNVYKDAGLTEQFNSEEDTLGAQAISAGTGDGVVYVGTPAAGNKIQSAVNPGVDPIIISVSDLAGGVDPVVAADIKLAITEGTLGDATGGDPLVLGATILGGPGNAKAVWYRWANGAGSGVYTNLELVVSDRIESAV